MQEHKLCVDTAVQEASAWLRVLGFKSLWGLALPGAPGHSSGGTLIAARDHLGLREPSRGQAQRVPGRLLAAVLDDPGGRPLALACGYLEVGSGLGRTNLGILEEIGRFASQEKAFLLAGCDWNLSPEVLRTASFLERAGLRTFTAGRRPTCRTGRSNSVIDFFVGCDILRHTVLKVEVLGGARTAPHLPVRLEFEACVREKLIPHFVPPRGSKKSRPIGPSPAPLDWAGPKAAIAAATRTAQTGDRQEARAALDAAFRVLELAIKTEIFSVIGETDLQPEPTEVPRIALRPALPRPSRPGAWHSQARPWKWVAVRLREVKAALADAARKFDTTLLGERLLAVLGDITEDMPSDVEGVVACTDLLAELTKILEALLQVLGSPGEGEAVCKAKDIVELFGEEAEVKLEEETKQAARQSDEQWTAWAQSALEAGAGRAHRWCKLPAAWKPTAAWTGSTWSGAPEDLLQGEVRKWGEAWSASQDPLPLLPPLAEDEGLLPPNTASEVHDAALTFGARSARTYDGIQVRQFSFVSEPGCEAICCFFALVELLGFMPSVLECLHMVLLEKPKGGHRGIGIFNSWYRLWARLRRPLARKWEASHPRAYLAAVAGSSCIDTIWRHALQAEAAANVGRQVAAFCWDLKEFYEHISRSKLLARARLLDFPLRIITVVLNTYGGRRLLVLGGVAAWVGYPCSGVVAGCGFATYLVQVYSVPGLDPFISARDDLQVSLWIDDFTCQAEDADEDRLVAKIVRGAAELLYIIEVDLEATVSCPKAAVVASSATLCSRIKKALGKLAGEARPSAEALGIDLVAGKPRRSFRRASVTARRLQRMRLRVARVKRLRKAGKDKTAKIFTAGLGPSAWYGMQVYGADDRELYDLQSAALAIFTPRAAGRDRAGTLLVNQDPCWRAAVGPIHRWCQEVWGSLLAGSSPSRFLSLGLLSKLFGEAVGNPPASWSQVRGPAGACLLSAKRLSWEWLSPFAFRTDTGAVLTITHLGPRAVEHEARASYFRRLERLMAKRAGLPEGSRASVKHAVALLRRTGEKALSHGLREGLKAVICDAVWTGDRLARAGYDYSPLCEHCGQRDTWEHRVLVCPVVNHLRQELFEEQTLTFLRAHGAHLRGLLAAPSSFLRPPAEEEGVVYWAADGRAREEAFFGDVFVDGSCSKHSDPYFDRAAWAVIKIDAGGQLLARLSGPVWHGLPQTSPAAEYAAIAAIAQVAAPNTTVHSDYSGTVGAFADLARGINGRRKFAGLTRAAAVSAGWPHIVGISKVAAHQELEWLDHGSRAWFLGKGNQVADSWAKEAVHRHPKASDDDLAKMDDYTLATTVLLFAAQLFEWWPKPGKLRKLPKEQAQELAAAGRRSRDDGHSWVHAAGLWRCSRCTRFAFSDPRGLRVRGPLCPGYSPALTVILGRRRGHNLQVHEVGDAEGFVLLICTKCGRWAGRRSHTTLTWACLGTKTKAGRDALKAVSKGLHPRLPVEVGPGYPVPLQHGEVA